MKNKRNYIKPRIKVKKIKFNCFYFTFGRSINDSIDLLYHADKLIAQDGCSCCADCSGSTGCGSCGGACG